MFLSDRIEVKGSRLMNEHFVQYHLTRKYPIHVRQLPPRNKPSYSKLLIQ